SPQNISNLFRQMSVTSIMAAGMVLVIVTGGIDLSVGRLAGWISTVVAYNQLNRLTGTPALAAILSVIIGLGVGTLWGIGQGYIISYLRVTAFIVTLGSYFILQGFTLLQTEGKTIAANQPVFSEIGQGYLPAALSWLLAVVVTVALFFFMFRGRRNKQKYGFPLPPLALDVAKNVLYSALVLIYVYTVNSYKTAPGIPYPVLILGIVAVIMTYVSNNTRFGRHAYAIGGNREAARLSGINIRKSIFLIFVLMGFLSGLAGIVLASYVGYGTIAAGAGYELDVIASAILGGTSTLGGVGTIPGAMIGGLIMASLNTGLQMMNAPAASTYVVKGAVLILAVLLDVSLKRDRT
ncbi:MAG TPA: sugar ABC transporter permease, partial [Anaerolineae bacterium]|nr:sugar ABC transporter permease [Anaerolineae bacterium]